MPDPLPDESTEYALNVNSVAGAKFSNVWFVAVIYTYVSPLSLE